MSSNTIIGWRPENVIRQLPWKLDRQAALGFLLILAVFSLVAWLYLTQASAVTTTSYRIDELRLELDQLENQNAALALEIAELQAISYVERRAQELGLSPTNNIRYLAVSNYPLTPNPEPFILAPGTRGYYAAPSEPDFDSPNWWTNTLDAVTAWLAKES